MCRGLLDVSYHARQSWADRVGMEPVLKDTLSLFKGIEKLLVNKQVSTEFRNSVVGKVCCHFSMLQLSFLIKKPKIVRNISWRLYIPFQVIPTVKSDWLQTHCHSCICQEKGYYIHTTEVPSVSFHDTVTCKQKVSKNDQLHCRENLANRNKHWCEVIYRSNHLFKAQFILL